MSDDTWKTTTRREGGIATTAVEKTSTPENWQEIAVLAYEYWQARGCPDGSPDEDWFKAEQKIAVSKVPDKEQVGSHELAEQTIEKVQRASGKA
jgi:hypothetical protein